MQEIASCGLRTQMLKKKKEIILMSTEEKWQKYVLVLLIKLHDSSARYQYFGEKGPEQVYSVS